jgi:MinD superfamily P-loop ATPase
MRIVNEFNLPGFMAPANFLPKFDDIDCTYCGRCARACPMGALVIDVRQRTRMQLTERCIGCGLCAVACTDRRAIAMEPVPSYKLPYKSWFSFQFHSTAQMLTGAWRAWRQR